MEDAKSEREESAHGDLKEKGRKPREDLEVLIKSLAKGLGAEQRQEPAISEIFEVNNISRVVEVGPGLDFDAITYLGNLRSSGGELLIPKNDLWVVDPSLPPEVILTLRFRKGRLTVESLSEKVKAGKLAPFDLVFSYRPTYLDVSGPLIEEVENFDKDNLIRRIYERDPKRLRPKEELRSRKRYGLKVISAMKDCLNPDNPKSTLMLFADRSGMDFLPYSFSDYEMLGLEIQDYQAVEERDYTQRLTDIMNAYGLFEPNDRFFDWVICEKA